MTVKMRIDGVYKNDYGLVVRCFEQREGYYAEAEIEYVCRVLKGNRNSIKTGNITHWYRDGLWDPTVPGGNIDLDLTKEVFP